LPAHPKAEAPKKRSKKEEERIVAELEKKRKIAEEMRKKAALLFESPRDTQASALRNQKIRQEMAIFHERQRLEEEEELEREERAKWVAEKIEPELKEMAAAVPARKKLVKKVQDKAITEGLKEILAKVDATEHMIRRNDRQLIYSDIKSRIRKETVAMDRMRQRGT
jgi:hypothetical protein